MPGHPKNPKKYQCSKCKRYFSSLAHITMHKCVQDIVRDRDKKNGGKK